MCWFDGNEIIKDHPYLTHGNPCSGKSEGISGRRIIYPFPDHRGIYGKGCGGSTGRDQSNKDEQILVPVTLIQNHMMELRVASLQGDKTMGKYLPLLGMERSFIHTRKYTKQS